ncbi:hypothetical protein Tco_0657172 [Tanacetum coccineum]|uniref:Xylulose kinase-1 n=1 Tax=Tanacetum coccineum TaxID=301880 RepID=A0ABQ4XBN0_9ASTR
MANLEFCDKHNMITYLQMSEGSEEFHQIIDFLNASHVQYALIENPTIYVSFIKQFWSTATARTSATGEVELTATIDGQENTITEASLRRHLKLEDNSGVTTLPNSEIFKQLALMGYETDSDKLTFQKVFSNMKRVTKGYSGEDIPLFASMITASETSPSRITSSPSLSPQHTPFTAISTSQPSNIHTTPVTKEAASIPMNHLSKVDVKKLEQTVKTSQSRRRTRVVLSDEEEVFEDPSKQGRSLIKELDLDAEISLVPPHDVEIQEKISDDTDVLLEEEETTELVEEPTELMEDQGSGKKRGTREKRKDKGKSIMIEDEFVQKKSKKQLEQERLSHEEAIRLQEQIDKEERKKITRDAKIAKQLQEEYDKAGKKEAVAEVDTAHVIDWNDPSNQGGYKMKGFKGMSYDDIRPIFEKVWDQVHSFVPMDSEEEVQRLKRSVHHVSTEKGQDIFMLVENYYPLTKGLATLMLCNKLRVDQQTKLSTTRPKLSTDSNKIERMKLEAMVEERRIFKCWFHSHTTNGHQFTMSNRHQEQASPEQTASSKDFSNPLKADTLAIPEQTATGKEISNPFMAGSLPKTRWPT